MDAEKFHAWLRDPQRDTEELFFAEILIEAAEDLYPRKHTVDLMTRIANLKARLRPRLIQPDYRPRIPRERVDNAAAYLEQLDKLVAHPDYHKRPATSLAALRFCPSITSLNLFTRLTDLRPLLVLPSLRSLRLDDRKLRDLSALRRMPRLRRLALTLRHPWPDPDGLESLHDCTALTLHLNLLILEGIPAWPNVETVDLWASGTPLRDLQKLPAMPRVKTLRINPASLDGIERYPTLEQLELHGNFEDLTPLSRLPRLGELTLWGEQFEDLAPLAKLPSLRRLTLQRERGLNLDPLLEAPRLRVVKAPQTDIIATELASLNAAIGWQTTDFVRETPRDLPPLRVVSYDIDHPETQAAYALPPPSDGRELIAPGDDTFAEAEANWLAGRLKKKLDQQLQPGWGVVSTLRGDTPLAVFYRETERLMAMTVLEIVRSVIAEARFPSLVEVVFDETEKDEWEEPYDGFDEDGLYTESEEERQETRQDARDARALREREHELRLGAQGLPVPPRKVEDLHEPPMPDPTDTWEPTDGGLEEIYPDVLQELRLTLTLHFAWMTSGWIESARAILGAEPEDWHSLPEPPEHRPRPNCPINPPRRAGRA